MNFPPACSRVSTTSAADMPSSGWMSVGMPRPSSRTVTLPSPFSTSSTVRGKTRLRLVHRVVDDLERHVMQARAVIGVADIHAGAATHRIEALQDRNGRGVIGVRIRLRRGVFGHAGERLQGLFGYSRYIAATACPGTGVSVEFCLWKTLVRQQFSAMHPQPLGDARERQEGFGIGAGDQRLRRQLHQRGEQRRASLRIEMHRRFVQQQHRREAARLGDQRGMAQDDADQQRLLLAGGRKRRGRAGHGIGQHHVGAVRADRGGSRGRIAGTRRRRGCRAASPRPPAPALPPAARRSAQSRPMRAAGKPGNGATAFIRATSAMRAAVAATACRAIASSSPASQAGSARPSASNRLRCAMAASCAATSRAWPGSSAHTSRSRKRRRPDVLSWNRRSICGVSHTAATRAAISAWLRGAAPSRRNTRRSGRAGQARAAGADIHLAVRRGEAAGHRPAAGAAMPRQIGIACAAQAAARHQQRHRLQQIGLAAAVRSEQHADPRARPPGQRGVVAEVGERQAKQAHMPMCGRVTRQRQCLTGPAKSLRKTVPAFCVLASNTQ